MDEWLGIFNVKLRHMREDIESVGTLDTFDNFLDFYWSFMDYNQFISNMQFIGISFNLFLMEKTYHICRPI